MMSFHLPLLTYLSRLARGVATFACVLTCQSALADIFIIVNTANPIRGLSAQEVADLYLGRTRTYPDGTPARVLDRPSDHQVREQFFRLLVNMPPAQVNAYWARLTFTGRQKPPEVINDDPAVIASVSKSERAIGYVAYRPTHPDIHVILQLRN